MKYGDQIQENLEQEIEHLREEKFLLPNEGVQSLSGEIYHHALWAEVFWRRRAMHSTREDPEIDHVFKSLPRSVLEIGSAYGRVSRKLAEKGEELESSTEITGIELCPYFEPYIQLYSQEYPVLRNVQVVYGDYFSSRKLTGKSYDVILLPMNTLPNFPLSTLPRLFKKVHDLLSEGGYWIFSTHKTSPKIYSIKSGYKGEILVEKGKGPIISEYYDFASQKTDHGARIVSYSRYTELTRDHEKIQSFLFRHLIQFILPEVIDELARKHDFGVTCRDDSSHSVVYKLQKQ